VNKGAKLKCPWGSEQSELEVVHLTERVLLCGKPMANVMDSKPLVNIKPFGKCSSLANPTVAAATSANYGRLQKMPCIPNTPFPWLNSLMNITINEEPMVETQQALCIGFQPEQCTGASVVAYGVVAIGSQISQSGASWWSG